VTCISLTQDVSVRPHMDVVQGREGFLVATFADCEDATAAIERLRSAGVADKDIRLALRGERPPRGIGVLGELTMPLSRVALAYSSGCSLGSWREFWQPYCLSSSIPRACPRERWRGRSSAISWDGTPRHQGACHVTALSGLMLLRPPGLEGPSIHQRRRQRSERKHNGCCEATVIDVQDLHFTYPHAPAAAVSGLTFAVPAGEVFGFLGPSGAGKSTTQKILIGLLHGCTGRVSVLGRSLTDWGSDLYERIGLSFELPNHFSS
jgi:ABC-type multidrug transport system fused ATPase/permease subunit